MKKYAKEGAKKIAADIFRRYPKVQKVTVTEDGQAFVTDDTDAYAKNHARRNDLNMFQFSRKEIDGKPAEKNGKKEKTGKQSGGGTAVEQASAEKKSDTPPDENIENE